MGQIEVMFFIEIVWVESKLLYSDLFWPPSLPLTSSRDQVDKELLSPITATFNDLDKVGNTLKF